MSFRVLIFVLFAAGAAVMAADKKEGDTTVTAKRLDFDYKRMVAAFTGDVVVTDPEVKIKTDKLTMAFDEEREVKLVTCNGNVKVWYEDKTASAKQAVYQARKGEIELLGDAVLNRGGDTIKGDRIVFNLYNETMICEPGFLVVTPGDKNDDGLKRLVPVPEKKK